MNYSQGNVISLQKDGEKGFSALLNEKNNKRRLQVKNRNKKPCSMGGCCRKVLTLCEKYTRSILKAEQTFATDENKQDSLPMSSGAVPNQTF